MPQDSSSSKTSPPAPSFYSTAGKMAAPPDKGAGPGSSTPPGEQGKKVENIKKLLEVFQQMDKLETDPENKDMIQSMVKTAEQYMQKLEGGGGGMGKPPAPAAGAEGAAPGAAGPAGGGAGAGPGAGVPA